MRFSTGLAVVFLRAPASPREREAVPVFAALPVLSETEGRLATAARAETLLRPFDAAQGCEGQATKDGDGLSWKR